MPATLTHPPTPPTSPVAWRDRKRYLWPLFALAPVVAGAGPAAHLLGATSELWFYAALLLFYGIVPLADALFGEDRSNPPESLVPMLEADPYYRRAVIAVIPFLWATLGFNLWFIGTHELALGPWLATVISSGAVLGFGLNVSHELGHKSDRLSRKLALFNAALGGYGHFSIEHNRGHHRHVATPEDPASSRMGESIWRFAGRELPGALRRAWALESDRLQRAGRRALHPDNEILQAGALTLVLYGSVVALWGWAMLPALAAIAFWGAFQLTSANYVEHYGLLRRRDAKGQYERCRPEHSWNSNHVVSNLIVFHLQRHSDHHSHPGRSYQSLRDFAELPRLPSGYFAMFLVAYLPPLWFALMDRRLVQAVGGDASRINFQPARRAALMRRYGLSEPAAVS